MTTALLPLDEWPVDTPLVEVSGPCVSPAEAYATVIDKGREAIAGDLANRSLWWRYRWLRRLDSDPRLVEVAKRYHVNPGTVVRYLHAVADRSNRAGTDAVFTYRSTLAEKMSVSVATVGRARAAAIELGYHTAGIQCRWIDPDKDGTDPWCGGAAVVFLMMPEVFDTGASTRVAARVEARRRAREAHRRRQSEQRATARQREIEALIDAAPTEAPRRPGKKTTQVRSALEAARRALDPP